MVAPPPRKTRFRLPAQLYRRGLVTPWVPMKGFQAASYISSSFLKLRGARCLRSAVWGNVVYENNVVYIDGQEVGTAADFALSAAELALAPPSASDEQAALAEWMPLGTFAISAHEKEADPARVNQLAVNRDGIVSGTLYNTHTDEA
jgi:hypothetical protein